jgi:hypothetical protein
MWQGDGGVATPSADIRGKPGLMSAIGHKQTKADRRAMSACPADCVAKLLAALRTRNYRIQMNGVFES